jgi:hypothetical protein
VAPEDAAEVRGAALCEQGSTREGRDVLQRDLALRSLQRAPASPFTARVRAQLGLCLLAQGQASDAAALAAQDRRTVAALGAVGPYFVAPLATLERALAARGAPPRSQH